MQNIDHIIKVYCESRKCVWFKNVNKCENIIEDPHTCIISTKNGEQNILERSDYVGPDILKVSCNSIEEAKKLDITNDTEFYFYIRGHIRNSFKTNRLKNFVELLQLYFPRIKFILQTWNRQECKNKDSWKNIEENDNIVSKSKIENYFENKNITNQCLIIDEDSIKLIGKTDGKIGVTPCPLKGWKNMWYGIYKGFKQLDNYSSKDIVVSFRYDYFDIVQSNGIDEHKIIQFIKNNLDTNTIQFIQYNIAGTDNLYLGKYNKINHLIEKFHFQLDDILKLDEKIFHQEILVNMVAKTINEQKNSNLSEEKEDNHNKFIIPFFYFKKKLCPCCYNRMDSSRIVEIMKRGKKIKCYSFDEWPTCL